MPFDPVLVYVTCRPEEAERIAEAVLDKRLAACANILPAHRSVYLWKGARESAAETAILFKTAAHLFPPLEETIRAHHSYECPCMMILPVAGGHRPFLEWLEQELTADDPAS